MTYLQQVESHLDLSSAEKTEVLKELDSHIADIRSELIASGMNVLTAKVEAEKRMGPPEDVAYRLNAAYNTASWRSSVFAALPFLASFLLLLFSGTQLHIWLMAVISVVTAVVSVRELICGRRPIWLAPWLAAAIYFTFVTIEGMVSNTTTPLMVLVFSFAVFFLIVAFTMRKWQLPSIILSGIYLLCAVIIFNSGSNYSTQWAMIIPLFATFLVMFIMLARIIFEFHPYGTAIRASLFLMSIYILNSSITTEPWEPDIQAVIALLAALLIILIARAKDQFTKVKLLFLGTLLLAVAWAYTPEWEILAIISETVLNFIILNLIVLFPLWCENRRKNAEPPLALE